MRADDLLASREKVCPVCGKTFYAGSCWVYKKGYSNWMKYYCSWKCMRKVEREHMSISDKINQAIRDGLTDSEIKKLLGVTQRQIDFRRNGKC